MSNVSTGWGFEAKSNSKDSIKYILLDRDPLYSTSISATFFGNAVTAREGKFVKDIFLMTSSIPMLNPSRLAYSNLPATKAACENGA